MQRRRVHTSALFESVAGLDAFIFDGKYLVDNALQEDVLCCGADMQQLINLDGLQRDRLHVTQALRTAFPLVEPLLVAMHGVDHGRSKILMIDFAYYVLLRQAFRSGHVVVPINQQSNDVRAANLTVLPGNDRKDYRSTEVVPRDGISLGSTRYLPRSVTICKAGTPGTYNFKLTSDDGGRKMVGFAVLDALRVYLDKVRPELVANDPAFLTRDLGYQELCRTYFVAFPTEATRTVPRSQVLAVDAVTPPPPFYPRGKAQLELKKRLRDESAAKAAALPEGMRECRTCLSVLGVDKYDDNRRVCKECRKGSRGVHDAAVVHDPETALRPMACSECGTAFDHDLFSPRGKGYRGTCRSCINSKGYSEAFRTRQRETDEVGYLQRNATSHLEWAHKHPQAQREQQLKQECEPDRAFKVFLTQARGRDIEVENACHEALKTKLSMACHYCDYTPGVGEHLNGLDRVDSDDRYTDANTVSCCSTCNSMKSCRDINELIYIMRRIRKYRTLSSPPRSSRKRLAGFGGWADLRAAPSKDKRDLLSRDQKVALWSSPCYLCGRGPALGIDREDSSGDYSEDNGRPCCSDCNYAKKHLPLPVFLEHVSHVCTHTDAWVLGDVLDVPLKTSTRVPREAVGMVSNDGITLLVFPSVNTAVKIIEGKDRTLRHAIETGCPYRGHRWMHSTPRTYRTQCCDARFCAAIIASAVDVHV